MSIKLSKIETALDESIDGCREVRALAQNVVKDAPDPYNVWAHNGATFALNGTILTAQKVGVVEVA